MSPETPKPLNCGIYLKSYWGSYYSLRHVPSLKGFGVSGSLCVYVNAYVYMCEHELVVVAEVHEQHGCDSTYCIRLDQPLAFRLMTYGVCSLGSLVTCEIVFF